MNLNASILAFELGGLVQGSCIQSPCDEANIGRVMAYADDVLEEESVLVVATAGQFAQFAARWRKETATMRRPYAFLVVGRPKLPRNGYAKVDVLWTSADADVLLLLNAVQRVFARFNRWEKDLGDLHGRMGTAVDIVQASLPLFQNDICLIDDNHRILLHARYTREGTGPENETVPETMPAVWIRGGAPQGTFDFQDFRPRFGVSPLHGDTPYIVVPLVLESDYRANLFVESSNRDVCDRDFLPALVLAEHVQRSFIWKAASSRLLGVGEDGYMMRRLVRQQLVSEQDLHRELGRIGWGLEDRFCCVVLDYPGYRHKDEEFFGKPLEPVIESFRTLPGVVAFRHNRMAVAVLDLDCPEAEDRRSVLAAAAGEYGMVAGFSDAFCAMMDLYGYYRQAEMALRFAFEEGKPVLSFRDCLVDYVAGCVAGDMPLRFAVSPGLAALARDPQKRHLYETVETYLECGCSASRAAERLFLRRNSVHYRLRQAEEAYGLDFSDPHAVFELQLSLAFLKRMES